MADPVLKDLRIRKGIWEGLLCLDPAAPAPTIEVSHLDQLVEGVSVLALSEAPGRYAIFVPIPVALLREGAHTFMIRMVGQDAPLGHFSVLTGIGVTEDLRQEVDLLRAELDLLKRAFRRHCQQHGG